MKLLPYCLIVFSITTVCHAQLPHVEEILTRLDKNGDGVLSPTEVAESARYAKKFARWDANNDNEVSGQEIIQMRANFGIAEDGSRLTTRKLPNANDTANNTAKKPKQSSKSALHVPDIADLPRVDRRTRPNRDQATQSAYLQKTKPHPADGDAYVILTDHTDEGYRKPLQRLAKFHRADLWTVEDLGSLYQDETAFSDLGKRLKRAKVKYVAIAPRIESFRENMLLSMWELLSTIDADPQLDCFPGFLLASNAVAFSNLIDQSIDHQPIASTELRPFAINQVRTSAETRSLQKSAILRKHFQRAQLETPIVAIYGPTASDAPRLDGDKTWNIDVKSRKQFVKELPPTAAAELNQANLIVMHGHGIPGMSCSMDIDGLPTDLRGKVLLSGSCFSACPVQSDLAAMRQAPGGYEVESRDAFVLRAIDNGAVVAFGHQRLNSGFPVLYPVLESWTFGKTVGQAYQELINSLIETTNSTSGDFIVADQDRQKKRVPQNRFLYVVIGDPALSPFQAQPLLQ